MTITSLQIYTGDPNRVEEGIALAAKAKKMAIAHGADDMRMGQIQTGQYTGHWLIATFFANMEAFGKAVDAMSQDPAFMALAAEAPGKLVSRTLIRGADIG